VHARRRDGGRLIARPRRRGVGDGSGGKEPEREKRGAKLEKGGEGGEKQSNEKAHPV